jgi:hypothetical protein
MGFPDPKGKVIHSASQRRQAMAIQPSVQSLVEPAARSPGRRSLQPRQPQRIGGVLDTAFELYTASIGSVWPISLLLAVAGMPPVLYRMIGARPAGAAEGVGASIGVSLGFNAADPVGSLVGLISAILTMWAMSALYLKQRAVGMGEPLGIGAALKVALKRLGPLFVASILFVLAVALGLVLLVVPGLILMVSLMMYMALLLFENKGVLASLTESHKLVWGNWWRSSAILAVALILLIVIFVAVVVLATIAAPLLGVAVEDAALFLMVTELVFNAGFNVLLMPFITSVMIALYWDLKLRKEGADLVARVNALNPA